MLTSTDEVICDDQSTSLDLSSLLNASDLLTLRLDPYIGELQIHLAMGSDKDMQGVATYLKGDGSCQVAVKHFSRFPEAPEGSFFLLIRTPRHTTCLFALAHQDQRVSIAPSREGLQLRAFSGRSPAANKQRPALVAVRGKDPYTLIRRCMATALELTGNHGKLLKEKPVLPRWLDTLGWEERGVAPQSHQSVVNSIDSLQKHQVPVSYALLNADWIQGSKFISFQADLSRFPYGLKGLVDDLHKRGIAQVGVSHHVMGAADGIHPQLAKRYDLPPDSKGRYFLGYDLGKTFQFYYDFYGFLRSQGLSYICITGQNSIEDYAREGMDPTALYKNCQVAIQAAASAQFNNVHFNTHCLRAENILYWSTARLARSCDSHDPGHPLHCLRSIRDNLSLSLWVSELMHPDCGPLQVGGAHSELSAVFHALSGAPIRIGGSASNDDLQRLHRLTLPSGRLPRRRRPLRLAEESIWIDPLKSKQLYKAQTRMKGVGIVVLFNLSAEDQSLKGTASPTDVPTLNRLNYAAYSLKTRYHGACAMDVAIEVELAPRQADIWTFAPIHAGVAVLGCPHFYHCSSTVVRVDREADGFHVVSAVSGPLLAYCEHEVFEVKQDNKVVPWSHDLKTGRLSINGRSKVQETTSFVTVRFER